MIYKVIWQLQAEDELYELPEKTANEIVKKIEEYVAQNPRQLGQPLHGNLAGLYRYRYND